MDLNQHECKIHQAVEIVWVFSGLSLRKSEIYGLHVLTQIALGASAVPPITLKCVMMDLNHHDFVPTNYK